MARPLVLGEDPGLLTPLAGPASLVLGQLWLVVVVGWAAWRISARQGMPASGVEAGLALLTALAFVSAAVAARYKHPAWLIAWEWGILLAVFAVVRRLVRTPEEQRSLLAALLASAVSISAYAVYQYTVELPTLQATYGTDPEKLREALAREQMQLGDDDQLHKLRQRILQNNAYGTFAHPNTFAGYLALFLPAAVVGAVLYGRALGRSWRTVLTAGCALLLAAALWLTHSRGAILATLLVGVIGLFAVARRSTRRVLGAAVLVLAVGGAGLAASGREIPGIGKAIRSFALRLDYWSATWRILNEHPWLGVGPGNFGRAYTRHMLPTAHEKIQDPHNFLLEIWAACGLFALLALIGTLVAGVREGQRGARAAAEPPAPAPAASPVEAPGDLSLAMLFYLGGMAGLLLAFLLRVPGMTSPDEILIEGLLSGGRALVWFAAFALLDGLPWTPLAYRGALAAGVVAAFLNMLVSGGLQAPSLMQPLCVVAALALAAPAPLAVSPRSWLTRFLPLPVLAAVCLGYLLLVLYPTSRATGELREARGYGVLGWQTVVEPRLREQLAKDPAPKEKLQALHAADAWLKARILAPLERAAREDPADIEPLLALAHWTGERWKLFPGDPEIARRAVLYAVLAQQLDPEGRDGYLTEYRLRLQFAQRAQDPAQVKEQYGLAARALRQVVDRDPTEARLRYQLADVLFQAGDSVLGRRQAEEAARLDELATEPGRRLSEPQREQVRQWLAATP